MNIGARTIKTGLSVTLAMILASLFGFVPAVISGAAAVMTIQPSVMRSWKYIKEVIIGNCIGAIFATIGYDLFGTRPIYIGLIVILTIAVNLKLGLYKTLNLSVLTVITILSSDLQGSTIAIAFNRFSLVGVGVLSSFLVNVIVLPPKHDLRLYDSIKELNHKIHFLLRIMPRKEITIRTYKSEKRTLDKLYGKTNELFEILNEEKRRVLVKDRNLFIKNIVIFRRMMRLIQKEIILIEKIHKQLNTFINISAKETKVIKDALNELLHYQQSIFLVYDGKIEQKTNEERKERKKKVINKFNLAINELMEHYEPTNEELWDRLFPIVNALIEVENEIKRLESLVNNYKIKEKNKKIRNQNSVTETVQKIVN